MDPVTIMRNLLTRAGEFVCLLGFFTLMYFVLLIT